MKKIPLAATGIFSDQGIQKNLVHDSEYLKIINFNLKAGQELPVHSHNVEGQLSILVLEGEGKFLGHDREELKARKGDILLADISEPHGVQATAAMRILVTIAPPI